MIRSPIRSASAGAAAYLLGHLLGLGDVTWAVISALFVLETSVGGTLVAALHRIAATALGIVVGGLSVLLMIAAGVDQLLALVLAVAAMAGISERRPDYRYGQVIVAIVILGPTSMAWEETASTVLQIAVGSLVGIIIGATVLPLTAERSSRIHVAGALRLCGELLETLSAPRDADTARHLHERIRNELDTAGRRMSAAHSYGWFWKVIRLTDRLWHTLFIVDRLKLRQRGEEHDPQPVDWARPAARLRELASSVERRAQIEAGEEDQDRDAGEGSATASSIESFAKEQVERDLGQLMDVLRRGRDD